MKSKIPKKIYTKKQITMNLSKEQLLGLVRHALTFVGGLLIMNGLVSETMISELSGAIMTLVGGIWSVVNKNNPKV